MKNNIVKDTLASFSISLVRHVMQASVTCISIYPLNKLKTFFTGEWTIIAQYFVYLRI